MKYLTLTGALIAALLATTASAQIINLQPTNPANPDYSTTPLTMTFQPGSYTTRVVGKAGGGLYDAVDIRVPEGNNFTDRYAYTINGNTTYVDPYNGAVFSSATEALDAFSGVLSSFTLGTATDVSFFFPDNWFYDNHGGVSLGVTQNGPVPVPEPATMGLFALGGGALLARSRKRKAAATA